MKLPSPLAVAIAVVAIAAAEQSIVARSPSAPAGTIPDDRIEDRITGEVTGPVIRAAHGWGGQLDDTIWIWSPDRIEPGERLAVTGRLRTPRGMLDPGAQPLPDRGDWEMSATRVEHLGESAGIRAAIWRWAGRTQASWAKAIDDAVGDRHDAGGAALRGIVTGDRGDVPDQLDQRWRGAGIFHALSVSGLHLAVVAGLAFALLRALVAASPWGGRIRPARWAAPPALVLAIAYTLITGAQVATVRALVVVAIALVAQMLDRPVRLVDALGLAAIALIAWHPSDALDPSFQLSFAAALALAVRPKLPPAEGRRALQWIVRGATTSAWIAIVTAPITAYHFHQVAAGGVIGNLVLTPILELVALPAGLAGIAIGGRVGAAVLAGAAWTVGRVDDLAGLLGHAMPLGAIAVASPLVMAILVAIAMWLCARARRTRLDAIAWLAMCLAWGFARHAPALGTLRVTFLDVGQGDAALVELPDGAAWLIDAGGLPSRGDLVAASAPGKAITRALEATGHTHVDLAVISHPHPDHYLGLAALAMPVAELWSADDGALDAPPPSRPGPLPSFAEVVARLGARVVHPNLGVARDEAGVELIVWAPRYRERDGGPEREAADPVRSVNDNSLAVELRYAGRAIVFAGDLEAEGEAALVDAGLSHVDAVKVAHHGSPTSSSPVFVAATHPELAVISCGVANSFGFPSPAVMQRWQAVGARVMRTDRDGAVTLTIAPTGELSVDTYAP
ncbi:MAG TPA: ComEC/Rec2 family competence protein [Kofleriaceae bacterium]|jgi:competence protein ComEC